MYAGDNGRPPLLAKRKRVSFASEPVSIINPKSNTAHHSKPPMATKPQPQSQQQTENSSSGSNHRRRMSISSRKRYMR